MAISVRGGAPVLSAVVSNPVSVTLTGTQQPQAGDLLVIIHFNDFYTFAAMPTPTVGGSTSGVTAITNGSVDAGSNQAHIKAYTYVVGSTGDLTVSVTESAPGDEDKGLAVYVLSGADTAILIDGGSAGAAGAFATTGQSPQPAPSVTPSGTDAFLIVHVNSGTGASAAGYTPPGSPYAKLYDGNATGGMSYTGGTEQLTTSGSTGTRSFTCNPVPWGAVTLAIATASGGGTPQPEMGSIPPTWWPGYGPWGAERFVPDPRSFDTPDVVSTVSGDATVTGAGSVSASAVQQATAAPSGAGSVSADGVIAGSATVTGAGSVTATGSASGSATATVTGAGAVSALATQAAVATQAGAGSVAASAVQQATASVAGSGAVSALATQVAGSAVTGAGSVSANSGGSASGSATVTGAGSVSALATVVAGSTVTGSGSVSAPSVQQATATVSGAGSVSALATQRATTTVAGAGSVTANAQGTNSGSATVAGAGSVSATATVTLRATASITGAGSVSASGAIMGAATLAAAGSVSAVVRQQATATVAGTGAVSASVGQTITATAAVSGAGSVAANGRPKWVFRPNTGTTVRPNSGRTSRPVGTPAITYRP